MNNKSHSDAALGIFVTPDRIEAVLLRSSGGQIEVVTRLVRQRVRKDEAVGVGSLATAIPGLKGSIPGLKGSEEADFTLQIGDGSGGSSATFMPSEFTGLGARASEREGGSPQAPPAPFGPLLHEILVECAKLGHERPRVAFCVGVPDVSYVELFVTRDQIDLAGRQPWSRLLKIRSEETRGVDRHRLLELLAAQHRSGYDASRVTFLPMTTLKGQQRFLALVPESSEPVTATLQQLAARNRRSAPDARLLGTELSLYTALARQALAPAENENTAIVRISGEDTLVVFLAGQELRHVERLRSLTMYDPPETICSRLLLQQDEQKIGEMHHVVVLSEMRGELFQHAFRKFYPNAAVVRLQSLLFKRGLQPAEGQEDGLRSTSVPAAGIGLRMLDPWWEDDAWGAVNLLPKKLRGKPKQKLAFAWHTFVALVLLFGLSFFFTIRYAQQQQAIEEARKVVQLNPPLKASPAVVQARVDSLKQVYRQYTHALRVLDSLLLGSDQWSRTLEKTARATGELDGVWFGSWQPSGNAIRIEGHALSRTRVAQFANRLNGEIVGTEFADVNDRRIYPFTMIVPRPIGMPLVADYLKDIADGVVDSSAYDSP